MSAPIMIGRLRVERRLGAGGFASVWLAEDPDLDTAVAVKILADNWAQNADVRRRFTDEARLLRRVDSDHLVRVYDVGELADGRPYFVMTYADHGTLAERLAAHPSPWPVPEVLRIVDAIADGLAVLHGHGVVHRDLKPRNLLLRSAPEGPERVLLSDLGIAKDLQWASGLTMPAGSDGYMAPEQREFSAAVGPATDVHALAMTAAQLLGVPGPPWGAGALGDVLARATAADPARRTSSAPQFAAALRESLTGFGQVTGFGQGAPAPPVTQVLGAHPPTQLSLPPQPGKPHPGRRLLALSALLTVVLLVAVAGLERWWTTRTRALTPAGGHVRVAVPYALSGTQPVPFPGGTDAAAGARARPPDGTDGRSVAVAYANQAEDPETALWRAIPNGCGSAAAPQRVQVGPQWSGVALHLPDCPQGAATDEVVLTDGSQWTVWVEVRSAGGAPGVTGVLASLEVTP